MDERGIPRHSTGQRTHAAWLLGDVLHVLDVVGLGTGRPWLCMSYGPPPMRSLNFGAALALSRMRVGGRANAGKDSGAVGGGDRVK